MVDSSKEILKEKTVTPTPTGFDMDSATISEMTAKFVSLVESHKALQAEHSRCNNQVNKHLQANNGRAAIDALLQQLQSAIDEENSRKLLEVNEWKDMLTTLEQQLSQMIKSGKSQSMQAAIKAAIDELRLDIANHEAQIRKNQSIYDDLMDETKAKLEQRIQ
jgi:hypothetical protein